ncbi:hypothetical protein IEQ34_011518 [Dendrobium chrysotoxum]|uniref:Uncharacterized protein n=1 Tax=Dendrobium chrysotoxum TaxID=161865 RepID=A0AAV7GT36_DENCH|nr:hypothetical protein IEQ34_011518 [Dendrobium chrysotoxum]
MEVVWQNSDDWQKFDIEEKSDGSLGIGGGSNDGERRSCKATKADDVASTVTNYSLIIFYRKFHFPNNLVVMTPKRFDQAFLPPSGYLTIYKINLQAGL